MIAQIYLSCHPNDKSLALDTVIQHKTASYFGIIKEVVHDIYLAYPTSKSEQAIGYISVIRNSPDLPGRGSEVDYLYVSPNHHRQGIGSHLLDRVRKDNQCESWVRCDRDRKDSIEWFLKKGYKYHHTEIGQDVMLSVLCWPGNMWDALLA